MVSPRDFYDQLAPFYPIIYADWEQAVQVQAEQLNALIQSHWSGASQILDVACGIGTQALGLAQLGYSVTASDLSPKEIEQAQEEAARRHLNIQFSVADMREVSTHHKRVFDVVMACDNAVPHLLSNDEILAAFQDWYACTRSGGGCLISVRDYEKESRTGTQVKPYGIRQAQGRRYLVFQVWEFQGDIYDISMYFVEDTGGDRAQTYIMRSRYYAVSISTLMHLFEAAGFTQVQRIDDGYFQPVIVAGKP